MRILGVVACVLISGAFSARAQASGTQQPVSHPPAAQQQSSPAAPLPKIDPQKEADIRQLVEVSGVGAELQQGLQEVQARMGTRITSLLAPGAYRKKLVALFIQRFNSKFDRQSVLGVIVPIYDQNYSDQDVKNLIQFFKSPLGQKYVSVSSKIGSETQKAVDGFARKTGRESMIEVLSEHPDLAKAMQQSRKAMAGSH